MNGQAKGGARGIAFRLQRIEQAQKLVNIMNEGSLPLSRLHSAETSMRVEDRQMGQADAGCLSRTQDPQRCLGHVCVATPPGRMMEIVELDDPAETTFQ